jgi:hypothetical protein
MVMIDLRYKQGGLFMPLSGGQIEFIQSSVGHLLELPADAKLLPQEITRIRDAFSDRELKPNDDYSFIQRPTEYLRRLENAGPTVNLGEVRTYLLDLATRRITEAAEKAHYQLTINDWNREQLQKIIADDKNSKIEFKTAPPPRPRDDIPPYPIFSEPDQIYSARLGTNTLLTRTYIHVDTYLPLNNKVSQILSHIAIPDFRNESMEIESRAEHAFLLKTAENSKAIAEKHAILQILKYLVNEKIITDVESTSVNNYSATLLTYSTYFNALLIEKLSLAEIANLNEKQVNTLTKPIMLELIRDGKSNLDKLKDLKPHEVASLSEPYLLKLVRDNKYDIDDISSLTLEQKLLASNPYYAPMVYDNKLSLNDIKKLTAEQCKTLILPSLIYLHQKNIIKLDEIVKMSKGVRLVISDEYYAKLLTSNKLDYKQIENIDDNQSKILLLPEIVNLISKEILTISSAIQLKSYTLWYISNDPIISFLISEKIIAPHDTLYISQEYPTTLLRNQKIAALNTEQLAKFKSLMQDFIPLAAENLLTDKDLHFIYLHFAEISSHFNNLQSLDIKNTGQNTPPAKNKLLQIESITKRCKINIQNRLQSILKNKQLALGKTFNDSISRLETACKKFEINFNEIKNKELTNALTRHYIDPDLYTLTSVCLTGYDLDYKSSDLHEQIFGSRLLAIYNKQPAKIGKEFDSLNKIQDDILSIAKIERRSTVAIQNLAIKYVLIHIKNSLQKQASTPGLHKTICDEINYLLTYGLNPNNELRENECVSVGFTYIIANAKLNYFKTRQVSYLDVSNEMKPSSKIFLPKKPSNELEELKHFCDKLSAIQAFFVPLKPLDMKIPATNTLKPTASILTS